MKQLLWPAIGALLVALGITTGTGHTQSLAGLTLPFLTVGGVLLGYSALLPTFYRSGAPWQHGSDRPRKLRLSALDYPKAFICWLSGFRRTYVVEPGLYYTGTDYDPDSPLLVTANYHLSVFLVLRHLHATNARLLVIDTDGINVWCAAGKGVFSNRAIEAQIERYDRNLLTTGPWLTIILPKFGMAGVDLRALRKSKIKPVVGPLYARDIPAYLASPPYRDRADDVVHFGIQMRAFTWLPGLVQFLGYAVLLLLVLAGLHAWFAVSLPIGLLALTAVIATAYPMLFPLLPGRRFAVKGLSLAVVVSLVIAALSHFGSLPIADAVIAILFTLATGIFFGLSYTGNSAVSAYTKVRKETAQFLIPSVLLYVATLVAFIVTEVRS